MIVCVKQRSCILVPISDTVPILGAYFYVDGHILPWTLEERDKFPIQFMANRRKAYEIRHVTLGGQNAKLYVQIHINHIM